MRKILYWTIGFPLVSLLLLEGVLQLSGLVMRTYTGLAVPQEWAQGTLRVVALGDSNTYGTYLAASDAYPKQLEALWNETHQQKVEVINLGYPGTNSSRLLSNLAQVVATFRPDIVLVMVGTNDFWTNPVADADKQLGNSNALVIYIREHSRVYRLYNMMLRQHFHEEQLQTLERQVVNQDLVTPEAIHALEGIVGKGLKESSENTARRLITYGDATFDFTVNSVSEVSSGYDAKAGLKNNVRHIMDFSRQSGVPVFLLGYGSNRNYYKLSNNLLRATVQETGYPHFIDTPRAFDTFCPEKGPCDSHFFPDQHAKPNANRIVAETIVTALDTYLRPQ